MVRSGTALAIPTITTGLHTASLLENKGRRGRAGQNCTPGLLHEGIGLTGSAHPPAPPQRAHRSPWHWGGSLQTSCSWQTPMELGALRVLVP